VRGCFRRLPPGDASEKAVNDWVSSADRGSEEAIARFLQAHTPGFGLLGEEGGARAVRGRAGSSTRSTARSTSSAASRTSRSRWRWSTAPRSRSGRSTTRCATSCSRRGAAPAPGATAPDCRSPGGRASSRRSSRPASRSGSTATSTSSSRWFHDVFLRVAALRRPGAASLDLAHTAAGIFDGFFEFCLSAWDIAAGALLVREAGGIVSDLDGRPDVLTHGNVVGASPGVHRELLEIIRQICRDEDIRP